VCLGTLAIVLKLISIVLYSLVLLKLYIPMAVSIAAGIAFATILTLVLVPSLRALLSDARLLVHRVKYGYWPKRVDVEPARNRHLEPLADESALETRWSADRFKSESDQGRTPPTTARA